MDASHLNYRSASIVSELTAHSSVLWVVVDGLGWLDHQELVADLATRHNFSVSKPMRSCFGVLPTKTEYAKWSLYAQLLPEHESWDKDIEKAFSRFSDAKRYTDHRVHQLIKDLAANAHRLYCWDTDQLDELYHKQRDWPSLYSVDRPSVLARIANQIAYYVGLHPQADTLQVVIASDHGQMLGQTEILNVPATELKPYGRMAEGISEDPRLVVLAAGKYGVQHAISVVRGEGCLGGFNTGLDGKIIGSHGGMFPEEVVVGVSVLQRLQVKRSVLAVVSGTGKAGVMGILKIFIDNPNPVELLDVFLYVNGIAELKGGRKLADTIAANLHQTLNIEVSQWPTLSMDHTETQLVIEGEVTYRFADGGVGKTSLDPKSAIEITQLFTSGLNIDDFI